MNKKAVSIFAFFFAAICVAAGLSLFKNAEKRKASDIVFNAMTHIEGDRAPILGLWAIPDNDNGGKTQAVAFVYDYNGTYYCRMIATFDESNGTVKDSIEKPQEKTSGISGNPYLCGLDFIYGLKHEKNGKFIGKVVNPDDGSVYTCEVWLDKDTKQLVVRGEFLIFGENQYWNPYNPDKLPFKIDWQSFKPNR